MKLSDTQRVLLSKAAQHPDSLVQKPSIPPAPAQAIIRKLIEAGFIQSVNLAPEHHRGAYAFGLDRDADRSFGYRITPAGLAAIGVEPEGEGEPASILTDAEKAAVAEMPFTKAQERRKAKEAAALAKKEARAADLKRREEEGAAEAAAPRKRKALAEAEAAADRGELPEPPDFSAATHAPYRKKLDKLIEMAKAGDAAGLRAFQINPTSTSPRAMIRYRDLAARAIEAKAG